MNLQRTFPPLDKWIYAKVYVNPVAGDIALNRYIHKAVESICPGLCDLWFFLRYSDPDHHIRIRFYVRDSRKRTKAFRILGKCLAEGMGDGIVHKWMLDTYEREVERYGADCMELTEKQFCIDSWFACDVIASGSYRKSMADTVALHYMHRMLDTYGLDLEDKIALCRRMSEAYRKETGVGDANSRTLNSKYRDRRKIMDSIEADQPDIYPEDISGLVKNHRESTQKLLDSISMEQRKNLNIESIIHLGVNRFYESNARQYEMVLYHILLKHYESLKHRMVNRKV